MKLSKETRDLLEVGDVLVSGDIEYQVKSIHECRYGGKKITVQWIKDPYKKELIGACLYGEPLSSFYGDEIRKGE